MRRRNRIERLVANAMLHVRSVVCRIDEGDLDCADALFAVVPDISGKRVLDISIFGFSSPAQRASFIEYCRRRILEALKRK